ncbi:MAG TPA: hypothetical protein VGG41_14475 [Solirubrobacteraceae bacterium]
MSQVLGRRLLAVAIASGLVAIVVCDLAIPSFGDWWDRHSLTGAIVSSLLVLGVTAVIVDEILARRQRRERATSVAVQGMIVYAQAVRAYAVLTDASPDGGESSADLGEEMRSLANMILTASPSLFDDPQARVFLENLQRLAGEMIRTMPSAALAGARPSDDEAQLTAAMSAVASSRLPLLARLPAQYRSSVEETT